MIDEPATSVGRLHAELTQWATGERLPFIIDRTRVSDQSITVTIAGRGNVQSNTFSRGESI